MGSSAVVALGLAGLIALTPAKNVVAAPALPENRASAADSCVVTSVGLGIEHGNWMNVASYFGRSLAQVFQASNLPISSVTVWRQRNDFINLVPMHLYIGTVRSDAPLEPQSTSILLDGPVLVLDGTSDVPRPVRFELVPPFALPGPGKYFFGIKEEWCGGIANLVADSTNAYPDGDAWLIHPYPDCGGALGPRIEYLNGIDLIFEVEYCDKSVAAVPGSWGKLKAAYR